MPFQPVGNACEVVIQATLDGEEALTPFGFLGTTDFDQADLENLASTIDGVWRAQALAQCRTDYLYSGVLARGLRNPNDWAAEAGPAAPMNGTLVGNPHPNNVSFVITKRTNYAGRGGTGRLYWPGINEGDTNGNYISSTRATAYAAVLSALKANAEADGMFLMAVISRHLNKQPRAVGIAFPMTRWEVRNLRLDSQRRRMPKV